eukprot:CAMPEP_0117821114 /NCGR_PEP_ID=MMETSP0949-20121206/2868_1 /TAXON_ID=44440 /ORGANISM="Chattonella subsalsa, Strain CCMP2191" /LENGTH=608 /DNA_ID=CAMNT_0005660193 /DNA_START=279 /DNA_END=2106 /DNA_ORIENTATION=-
MPYFPFVDELGRKLGPHMPLWKQGQRMDLYVYLSTEEKMNFTDNQPAVCQSGTSQTCGDDKGSGPALLWKEEGLVFDFGQGSDRSLDVNVTIPEAARNNGSLFAHVFLTYKGVSPSPHDPTYSSTAVAYKSMQMNRYRLTPKKSKRKNLLSNAGESEDDAKSISSSPVGPLRVEDLDEQTAVNYWKPSLSIDLVHLFINFGRNAVPPQIQPYMEWDIPTAAYYPVLYQNEFWLMSNALTPMNETTPVLPLSLSFNIMSFWKFQLMTGMENQWAAQTEMGYSVEGETDTFRQMLLDTSPWLLGVTFVVSLLHTIFDFLAFKNDVKFWKGRKSVAGLSVRSIMINCFFQTIIFLYLMDDNDTSWMILISSGVGLGIEFWKITKAIKVNLTFKYGFMPWIKSEAKESYVKSHTKEYDDIAMANLFYIIIPLIFGYSAYLLLYGEHKSWYSWVLSSLVSFIYAFGFIMMTPQLFINYKLKSVAHLPWRVMVYKSLNTFIDDLFAFIIKMPTMHRLACLRDDVIFFIFLYQKWIYPIDKSRTNEYGQTFNEEEQADGAKLVEGKGAVLNKRSKFDRVEEDEDNSHKNSTENQTRGEIDEGNSEYAQSNMNDDH